MKRFGAQSWLPLFLQINDALPPKALFWRHFPWPFLQHGFPSLRLFGAVAPTALQADSHSVLSVIMEPSEQALSPLCSTTYSSNGSAQEIEIQPIILSGTISSFRQCYYPNTFINNLPSLLVSKERPLSFGKSTVSTFEVRVATITNPTPMSQALIF